jgi:chromosome segregation ATPase
LQRYEEEVQQLQDKLDTAVGDKGQVEKIADEAISAQDSLEANVKMLEKELLKSRRHAESSQDEFEALRRDKDGLNEELLETRKHLQRLDGDNKAGSKAKSALELSFKQVEKDRLLGERNGWQTVKELKVLKRNSDATRFLDEAWRRNKPDWRNSGVMGSRSWKDSRASRGNSERP